MRRASPGTEQIHVAADFYYLQTPAQSNGIAPKEVEHFSKLNLNLKFEKGQMFRMFSS